MKKLIGTAAFLLLAGCAMTPEEMNSLNASIQQLGQSAQGWGPQASGTYIPPQAASPYGNSGAVTYRQVGDTLIGSNGVTYRSAGSSIIGSDGTTCQVVGQQMICR